MTLSMGAPALSLSLMGRTRITTLTLSFWAVVLSAAIDCLAALRLRPDYEMVLTRVGSKLEACEVSSSESIEEVFFSLAEGVIKRDSFTGSLNVRVPICLGVTSYTSAISVLTLSVYSGIVAVAKPTAELFAEAMFEAAFASMLPLLPFWMTELDIKGGLFPLVLFTVVVKLCCKFLS